MPRIDDVDAIARILETDRVWGAYALADLEPDKRQYCTWLCGHGETPAIGLIYREFARPVLVTVGPPEQLADIVDEIDAELADADGAFFVVRPDAHAFLQDRYEMIEPQLMRRMSLPDEWKSNAAGSPAKRLHNGDLGALRELYADGEGHGDAPDWFIPAMLKGGVYYGVWEGNALVAAAGTHVVAPNYSAAAIGNVYTRRDRRRRGLGAAIMNSVARELRDEGIRTVVLNVASENTAAISMYERLGFRAHCDFYETIARRR